MLVINVLFCCVCRSVGQHRGVHVSDFAHQLRRGVLPRGVRAALGELHRRPAVHRQGPRHPRHRAHRHGRRELQPRVRREYTVLESNRALLYNHSLTAMAGESYNRAYGVSIQSYRATEHCYITVVNLTAMAGESYNRAYGMSIQHYRALLYNSS